MRREEGGKGRGWQGDALWIGPLGPIHSSKKIVPFRGRVGDSQRWTVNDDYEYYYIRFFLYF